ncbi:unnamed protein product [Caenorhabditis brenneri]
MPTYNNNVGQHHFGSNEEKLGPYVLQNDRSLIWDDIHFLEAAEATGNASVLKQRHKFAEWRKWQLLEEIRPSETQRNQKTTAMIKDVCLTTMIFYKMRNDWI